MRPSDATVAVLALEAAVEVPVSPSPSPCERNVESHPPAESAVSRLTPCEGEYVSAVEIPGYWAGGLQSYQKVMRSCRSLRSRGGSGGAGRVRPGGAGAATFVGVGRKDVTSSGLSEDVSRLALRVGSGDEFGQGRG